MPILNFDSSERWRPLNVEMFLNETNPSTGAPWNQICSPEAGCTGLTGDSSLRAYPTAQSYISMHRDANSDPDSYESPHSGCLQTTIWGTQLLDCDSGSASAISYNFAGPSPGGYLYIEYWFFYRYNQGWEDIGNHAGDWEGVTVAPTDDDKAIAYVELSHHGAWDAYLPSNLDCGPGVPPPGTCSTAGDETADSVNVDVFPAAGSHANYPQPNDSDFDDRPDDGLASWANNLFPSALIPMPATAGDGNAWTSGPENWTDWPGAWGDTLNPGSPTGSPCGPAAPTSAANGVCGDDHGGHYYAPWSQTGTNLSCSGADCPQVRPATSAPTPDGCFNWFGGGVVIAACDERSITNAVRSDRFVGPGRFTISLPKPRSQAGTGPGVAQLLGVPLDIGERAVINGVVPRGTELFVRAQHGRTVTAAAFDDIGPIRGRATILVRYRKRGGIDVIVESERSVIGPTLSQSQTMPRR